MSDSSNENTTPTLVNISITSSSFDYIRKLMELGAIEGGILEKKPAAELLPLIDAIHHVLAGGKAQVNIERNGSSEMLEELRSRLESSISDSNTLAKKANYVVALQG